MSEAEFFKLDDGAEVSTGLVLPDATELKLMASLPEYPQEFMLDRKDMEAAFKNEYYKKSRSRLRKYMINQSRLGKCNASAVVGAFDQVCLNQGMPHAPLSDCDLYMRINGGRDSGSALIRGFEEAQRGGVSTRELQIEGRERLFPLDVYNARQLDRKILEAAKESRSRHRGWEWYRAPLDYSNFKVAIASALAHRHPVVFAWHVGSKSMRLRNGYVQVGSGRGNHANVFHSGKWVGGDDLIHPDDRNNWGPVMNTMYGPKSTGWGDGGFGLFTMQDAYRCVKYHYTYICTSVRPDPMDRF